MADAPRPGAARPVDATALRHIVRRLQAQAGPPWLHAEVARRMAERLAIVRREPACVVDWGCRLGASADLLSRAYPRARRLDVEEAWPAPAQRTAASGRSGWWPWRRRPPALAPVVDASSLGEGVAELLWSNMDLHWQAEPEACLQRWHRVLAPGGFLMFSTLGPGTLSGLREAYRRQGWPTPMAPLVDMHDLGDMLVQAGFADPVMDQETLTLTWPDAPSLLAELRSMGGNADPGRGPGLRSRRWLERLQRLLDGLRGSDGRLALEFEIVYGHAFRGEPRVPVSPETSIAVEQLRSMARSGRTSG